MRDLAVVHAAPTLTPRQQQTLEFIIRFRAERGYSPTVREIMQAFGARNPNGAMCHIQALRRKGVITSEPGKSRTIRPVAECL